jgi:hypothetical protein
MTEKKLEEMTVSELNAGVINGYIYDERYQKREIIDELIRHAKLYEQSQQLAVKELEDLREEAKSWTWDCIHMDLAEYLDRRISALKKGEG